MEAPPQVMELERALADSLSKLSAQVVVTRNELAGLEKAKEDFFLARDQEARERVMRVYQAAKDALSEAGDYLSTVTGYANTLKNIGSELKATRERVEKDKADFIASTAATREQLEKATAELQQLTQKTRGERALLEGERAQLARERKDNALEKERIASERYSLAIAIKDLEKLKQDLNK